MLIFTVLAEVGILLAIILLVRFPLPAFLYPCLFYIQVRILSHSAVKMVKVLLVLHWLCWNLITVVSSLCNGVFPFRVPANSCLCKHCPASLNYASHKPTLTLIFPTAVLPIQCSEPILSVRSLPLRRSELPRIVFPAVRATPCGSDCLSRFSAFLVSCVRFLVVIVHLDAFKM